VLLLLGAFEDDDYAKDEVEIASMSYKN